MRHELGSRRIRVWGTPNKLLEKGFAFSEFRVCLPCTSSRHEEMRGSGSSGDTTRPDNCTCRDNSRSNIAASTTLVRHLSLFIFGFLLASSWNSAKCNEGCMPAEVVRVTTNRPASAPSSSRVYVPTPTEVGGESHDKLPTIWHAEN